MTTINNIEKRILEMDGGEFHKLCDAYLSAKGYGVPHSLGSLAGANKGRRGTPDTFFEGLDGKFIFAEYTTQSKNLFGKLKTDLGKCLNERKTGIAIVNIEEIVMCFSGVMTPKEVLSLNAESRGVKLTLFGISAISTDLLKHPFLIRKYLDLSLDTGQIIPLESFPSVYGRSKFATTLETKFHYREKEKTDVVNALASNDLVIISGRAGIGKSRLALECCRNFIAKKPEYESYAIVSQNQNLFDDLKERFSSPGNFLILVDDANRVSSFSYFMDLLRNKSDDQRIKVIVTVRDYAADKIREDIGDFPYDSISIDRLTDDQIRELAKVEFGILNSDYLERIVDLSKGNPRISVMICKVAIEKNTLESIKDVSALFDEYFSSFKGDLKDIGNKNILRIAGIIAFHRAIDRANIQIVSGIESTFSISPEEFWDGVLLLHQLEMVDMYENEVVRISDQVLSTYLIYLVFFKEKLLDFSSLLENYFPMFRSKINDALLPTLSAFDRQFIFNVITPMVEKVWGQLDQANDEDGLMLLAESFYYLLPTETLYLVKKRLSQSQFAPADLTQLEELDDNKLRNIPIKTEVQLLGRFRHGDPALEKMALQILFNYLETRPAEILQVLHVLTDDFGVDRFFDQYGVGTQQEIVDILWRETKNGQNELFSRIFISVGQEYLKTNFESIEMRSQLTVTIYQFSLLATPEILQLRSSIWDRLFMLYMTYPEHVYGLFMKYLKGYHQGTPCEIFSADSAKLITFINANLSPKNLKHIIFVNDYLDFLEDHKIHIEPELREKFQGDAFKVYQLITENWKDLRHLTYEEFQAKRKSLFSSYFKHSSKSKIRSFIDLCIEVGLELRQEREFYDFISGFFMGLEVLFQANPKLFIVAIGHYLECGDILGFNPVKLINQLILLLDKKQAWKFINEFDYPTKDRWIFGYYQALPPRIIDSDDAIALYKHFEISDYSQFPDHLDFLCDFALFDQRIIAKVAELILEKADPKYLSWGLNSFVNPYSEISKHLEYYFKEDIPTLEKTYLAAKSGNDNADHNSATLSKILELDPNFIEEYVKWISMPKSENSRWHQDLQDYSMLWKHRNYRQIFKKIAKLVFQRERKPHWYTELKGFFMVETGRQVETDIAQRQEELLSELINENYEDIDFIEYLFEVTSCLPRDRRSRIIFAFLQKNHSFSDFKRIRLEPASRSWSGSAVPMYQERIDFIQSVLRILDDAKLLEHRVYVEKMITNLKYEMNQEKKQDFMGRDTI